MSEVNKLADKIQPMFKDLPPLSDSARETLAKVWPWIALVFGIVQLWAAWALYGVFSLVDRLSSVGSLYSVYATGAPILTSTDKMFVYIGIAIVAISGVILLMAFPKLKARSAAGWNLVFLGAVLNVVYSVVSLFIYGQGFGSLLFGLIGSAIGFYLLFQVRSKFKKEA